MFKATYAALQGMCRTAVQLSLKVRCLCDADAIEGVGA
jgi:hypothetical protein